MTKCIDIGVALNELEHTQFYDKRDYETAKETLKTMPAADVQEIRHGKWISGREISRDYIGDDCMRTNFEDWHCSACGFMFKKHDKPNWNFCPNCGAYMRGK